MYTKLNKLKLDRWFIFRYTMRGSVIVRNEKRKLIFTAYLMQNVANFLFR